MDFISWFLNAIDTIISTRSAGSWEPVCPDGTYAAGYTMDPLESWRIMCLVPLSMEDTEDVYIFGFMVTGLLRIRLGIALIYRKLRKAAAATRSPLKLDALIDGVGSVEANHLQVDRKLVIIADAFDHTLCVTMGLFDRKLVDILGANDCGFGNITEKLTARQRSIEGPAHEKLKDYSFLNRNHNVALAAEAGQCDSLLRCQEPPTSFYPR